MDKDLEEDKKQLQQRKERLNNSLRMIKTDIEEKKEQKRQLEDGITNINAKLEYINILQNRKNQEDIDSEEVVPNGET